MLAPPKFYTYTYSQTPNSFITNYYEDAFRVEGKRHFALSYSGATNLSAMMNYLISLESPKVVRLFEAEKRLGMSRETIIAILEDAGFNIPNTAGFYLTAEHVRVLSKAYEKSLSREFKKTKKAFKGNWDFELWQKLEFFRPFIKNEEIFYSEDLLNQELDSVLIESWFFNLVTKDPSELRDNDPLNYILRKLKFKLLKLYNDIRTQIFSLIFSHHYYIFPGEEDGSEKANRSLSFSEAFFERTRKAIINMNFIKAFKYEKYRTINTQYISM